MFYLIFLLSIAAPALGNFMAEIVRGPYYEGTAAIIGSRFLITTANLVRAKGASSFQVTLGSEFDRQGDKYDVLAYVIHPQYDAYNDRRGSVKFEYDVAILVLDKPIPLKPGYATKLDLPAKNQNFSGRTLKIYGWGFLKQPTSKFQESNVNIYDNASCKSFGYAIDCAITLMGHSQQPMCNADIGSPVVDGNVLAGINFESSACTSSKLFSTNIAAIVPWINQVMNDYTNFY